MSLLIDALRKAEKDREQAGTGSDGADDLSLSLEPIAAIPEPPQTLPPEAFAQREAAANLFEVKEDPRPQGRLIWLAVSGVAAGLCIGAYVWWQMQPVSTVFMPPGPFAEDAPRPVAPQVIRPAPAPAAPVEIAPPEIRSSASAGSPEPASTPNIAQPSAPAPEKVRRGDLGRQANVAPPPPEVSSAPAVRLARSRAPQVQVPGTLTTAYQAYQEGRLADARALYTDYLRQDPNNVDALNGLGAIALQEDRLDDALRSFRAALTANPGDPVAQAGIASISPDTDPVAEESRLRDSVDATDNNTPATRFALGNALAQQGRWSEAQSAYFDAHVGDPDNPDYLFNLAVSLDQLAQPGLARDYYQRALEAATRRTPAFDPAPVRTRLIELGGRTP